jgi:DNA-directed RNA polymerase subunit RPC12/RpoP
MLKFKCIECKHKTDNEDSNDNVCPECGGGLVEVAKKEKMKLPITNMNGVEILDIGTWNGKPFTGKDFDEAIDNFKAGLIEPYISLNHDPEATEEGKRALKMSALGFVKKLYKKGTKLIADFKQVPKHFAELVEAGALKKRSVEWWKRGYRHANGNIYNNVLEAITFHGADGVPAVNTLADIKSFYKLDTVEFQGGRKGDKVTIDFKDEEDLTVGEIKIDQAEYDKLKSNQKTEEDNKVIAKLKADKAEADKKVETAEAEKLKAEEKAKEAEKKVADSEAANLKSEAEGFVDKIIETDHKLLPKFKDMKVAEYIRLKSEKDEEGLKLFKEELEGRGKILNFGTITEGGEAAPAKFKSEDSDVTGDPTERAQEAIEVLMKKDGITWEEAAKKLEIPMVGGDE